MQTIHQADHTAQMAAYPWTLIHDDRACLGWFAALVDTCGTIQAEAGQVSIQVDHANPSLIARVAEIAEVGTSGTNPDGSSFWRVTGNAAFLILVLVAPHLVIQKRVDLQALMVATGSLQPGHGLGASLAI